MGSIPGRTVFCSPLRPEGIWGFQPASYTVGNYVASSRVRRTTSVKFKDAWSGISTHCMSAFSLLTAALEADSGVLVACSASCKHAHVN